MALLQRCQQGDKRALIEARQLSRSNAELIERAKECLTRGQTEVAAQRRLS
jgi:hypothetical protein